MKPSAFFLFAIFLLFVGCSSSRETQEYTLPALLKQTPLPPLPPLHPLLKTISVALYIDSAGSVTAVRFLKGSINPSWDSTAAQHIKSWKFAPAQLNGKPISVWYRYQFSLLYTEAKSMHLAEILCPTKQVADSLVNILRANGNFAELAAQFSLSDSRKNNGDIGEVNIYSFPKSVWSELLKLEVGEITQPIPFGRYYAIFKRLPSVP